VFVIVKQGQINTPVFLYTFEEYLHPMDPENSTMIGLSSPDDEPILPLDVIELIIRLAWRETPMTTFERCHFMKTSLLVNSDWIRFFINASSTHLHLTSGKYTFYYSAILNGKSKVYSKIAGIKTKWLRERCRVITIHCIDPRAIRPSDDSHEDGIKYFAMASSIFTILIGFRWEYFPT
jgi:hypothetical protein